VQYLKDRKPTGSNQCQILSYFLSDVITSVLLTLGCINARRQVAVTTEFCTLAPRILRWLLDFWGGKKLYSPGLTKVLDQKKAGTTSVLPKYETYPTLGILLDFSVYVDVP
jgi:hypothetical protein